jgi:hypothetical protein
MNAIETRKVLTYLYADLDKPLSEGKVAVWTEVCSPVPFELGMLAAKRMLKETHIFGVPSLTDYREHVNFLHRAARDAKRGIKRLDPAIRARMTPSDVELYDARIKAAMEISKEQAKALLAQIKTKKLGATS